MDTRYGSHELVVIDNSRASTNWPEKSDIRQLSLWLHVAQREQLFRADVMAGGSLDMVSRDVISATRR